MNGQQPSPAVPHDRVCLEQLGQRVRQVRARRGMSRRILAQASGISQRYLAQLEAGQANVSLLVLHAIAAAMNAAPDDLIDPRTEQSADYLLVRERLRKADERQLGALLGALKRETKSTKAPARIALIGLRGAGKSTLGQALAKQLKLPFVELVQEIERTAGMAVNEIFSLGGQSTYRRFETAALKSTIEQFDEVVIAVGGSLVSEPESFELLLSSCYTIWVKASAQEHMDRVVAQGDHRPMADHRNAMDDLKRILTERSTLYGRADRILDTSGQTPVNSLRALAKIYATAPAAPAP